MSDSENKLKTLEQRIGNVNDAKIRAEATLDQLRKQRDDILARLNELGVDSNTLASQIETLEQEIKTELTNIEAQIPEGF